MLYIMDIRSLKKYPPNSDHMVTNWLYYYYRILTILFFNVVILGFEHVGCEK